jgi:CRP-like cAMP-binding protein
MAQHFEDVTAPSVQQRLARKLVRLAERRGRSTPLREGVVIDVALSQQELAELAETSRQSVNRWLQAWRDRRIVGSVGRRLLVRDLDALRRIAAG